ncbi:MAG: hypothetical protein DYG86_11965 [Chloroflexi bacterium CFX2]|nr:hypothetical protein [Chloroflexi bacterium CFX2]
MPVNDMVLVFRMVIENLAVLGWVVGFVSLAWSLFLITIMLSISNIIESIDKSRQFRIMKTCQMPQ